MNRILRNARRSDGSTVDLEITDGHISAVSPCGASPATRVPAEDLAGWLVLPSLAEPHAHLDKACSAETVGNPSGDLDGAIAAWSALGPVDFKRPGRKPFAP